MDSGYESETGQVCQFNVTPFTPYLPHWQHEVVCDFLLLCCFYVFVCTYWYSCGHALLALWLSTLKVECDKRISWFLRDVAAHSGSLTQTPNTKACTRFGWALNCMNNKTGSQCIMHFSQRCALMEKCVGTDREKTCRGFSRLGISFTLQASMTWMEVSPFLSFPQPIFNLLHDPYFVNLCEVKALPPRRGRASCRETVGKPIKEK